jgi:hypothetical protein
VGIGVGVVIILAIRAVSKRIIYKSTVYTISGTGGARRKKRLKSKNYNS